MTRNTGQNLNVIDSSERNSDTNGAELCPRCGAEMVTTSRGVSASFPSPALDRLVCSGSNCGYVKYVKLDSLGYGAETTRPTGKGEKGAQ